MFLAQNEQRSFQRMELELPVEMSKGTIAVKGICKDLSSSGMLLTFKDTSFQAGDKVHIKLDTADERFPPLDAEATLLRIDEHELGFSAALKFFNIA